MIKKISQIFKVQRKKKQKRATHTEKSTKRITRTQDKNGQPLQCATCSKIVHRTVDLEITWNLYATTTPESASSSRYYTQKPRERAAAVRIIGVRARNGEMRRDGNSIVALRARCTIRKSGKGGRRKRGGMHRTAVARENRVGVRQCTSISPAALQLRSIQGGSTEKYVSYTRARTHTGVCTYIETRMFPPQRIDAFFRG